MDASDAHIALNLMEGVGPITVRALGEYLGGVEALFSADAATIAGCPGVPQAVARRILEQRAQADPAAERARAEALGIRLITPVDAEYPEALRSLRDAPLALYVQGGFAARDTHAVAIVGTRSPSHYGKEMAERLAIDLARAGYTVVSGLARGVDTAAHAGALRGEGRTIAFVGSGLDCLYPPENAALAQRIAGCGAVVSEFALGRQADRTTFPIRNRLVSGLSRAVLVVEAGLTSGAMITARLAGEQGRTVMALPGRVDNHRSRGPHALLRDGARLVEGVADVLDELGTLLPARGTAAGGIGAPSLLDEREQRVVDALSEGEVAVDQVIRITGIPAADMNVLLLKLEMRKVLRMLPGRMVGLVAAPG